MDAGLRGALLETLHNSHEKVDALEALVREMHSPRPDRRVVVAGDRDGAKALRWAGAGPWPLASLRSRRIVYRRPDNVRIEERQGTDAILAIRRGDAWWRWGSQAGVTSGSVEPTAYETVIPGLLLPALLYPNQFLATVRFVEVGEGRLLDRAVFHAIAVPREPPRHRGDLQFEICFDVCHGTMLRYVAREDGHVVRQAEVEDIVYEPELSDDEFKPPGHTPITPPAVARPADLEPTHRGEGQIFTPQAGGTVWLLGSDGDATRRVAVAVVTALSRVRAPALMLDARELESSFGTWDGLADEGHERLRRVALAAALPSRAGVAAIVTASADVATMVTGLTLARAVHEEQDLPFVGVWVDAEEQHCEETDSTEAWRTRTEAQVTASQSNSAAAVGVVRELVAAFGHRALRVTGHAAHEPHSERRPVR